MDRWCTERPGLAQTSAAIGHAYVQPAPFLAESCKDAPFPPLLQRQSRTPGHIHYNLTSHTEHDHKPIKGPLENLIYCKASPHWNTHFLNELAQRLRDCQSIRLVSKPVSEMQDRYRGHLAPDEPLVDHYRTLVALYGQLDRAPVPLTKEPLLSTAQAVHRRFSRSELAHPSALNAPAIQGTLTKSAALSRLPPHKALPNMSSQLQLPRPCVALPHGGRTSLYTDSFTVPAYLPKLSTSAADHDTAKSRNEGSRGLRQHVMEVPKMYGTENQTYGKGKMVLV
ncbi:uncharacterized protein zgc:193811 [Colossoma macropomum]|uniref:uncharacterized protein zgc:193811 n=1 Tax=Colossoma macropomum TaxID=42526 RepID=UPI00186416B4|nr:uncharacterized protein zgc:193811 [Colossoma macropomum]